VPLTESEFKQVRKLYLYRFMSLELEKKNRRVEQLLKTSRFHFSHRNKLNDPMEVFFWCGQKTPVRVVENLVSEKERVGICCFSKRYDNVLMWAYYAYGHQGLCVEIDPEDGPVDPVGHALSERPELFKVNYRRSIPWLELNQRGTVAPAEILTTKVSRWRGEGEFRFLKNVIDFDDKKESLDHVGAITRIFWGVRTDQKTKVRLQRVAQQMGIECVETKINISKSMVQLRHD
jgi:hypothetical protein